MATATFVTDAELTRLINQSWTRFRALVSIVGDHDYYLSSGTVSTSSGTSAYALPSDFLRLKGADVPLGADTPTNLEAYNFAHRNRYAGSSGWSQHFPIAYRLQAANINFIPTPLAVHVVTLYYLAVQTDLSADDNTLDGFNGWEEWIVCDAALKCLEKQRQENPFLQARRDEIKAEILAEAAIRDQSSAQRMVDVTDRFDGPRWY